VQKPDKKGYTEEYVKINGIHQYFLHYPSEQREVILHLHGGPGGSSAQLAYTLRQYWDFCGIVYYDQRGTGKTLTKNKTHPHDITLENLLEDLRQTIIYVKEKYQTDRIILLGHSWGSVLGTQYILRYPNDVIAYIGYGQVVDMLRGEKLGYDELRKSLEEKGAVKGIKKLDALGDYPHGAKNYPKTILRFRKLQIKYGYGVNTKKLMDIVTKSPLFTVKDGFAMWRGQRLNKRLVANLVKYNTWDITDYSVPVYYILGRKDWQTPSVLAAEYFERINTPQKGLYWLEDVGHFPEVDNPEGFCAAVKEIVQIHHGRTSAYLQG